MNMYEVYTDGAYSPLRKQGGYSFIIVKDSSSVLKKGFNVVPITTVNRMEMMAVIQAIHFCKKFELKEIKLYSDSMYVIGTMTLNWKKKKNLDLWKILDEKLATNDLIIHWVHVKGHSNNEWNDYCDKLAVLGSHLIIKE